MSWILKLIGVLPELIALLKQIIDLVKGAENKVEAKAQVKKVCEGIACSADIKK